MDSDYTAIKRALISVSDKTGIVEFAKILSSQSVEILSTGGTYQLLIQNDIPAIEVSDFIDFPEIMGGRVKTLHPRIHGGILARRGVDNADVAQAGIQLIDLVVVNLYPFEQTIAKSDCTLPQAIEQIDIGGPTMIRAAAKNYQYVSVVVDKKDYQSLLENMNQNNEVSKEFRYQLAVKAFEHTACYDAMVANYLGGSLEEDPIFPRTLTTQLHKKQPLRYGENPHQKAALYVDDKLQSGTVAAAQLIQGKELSFNNLMDADAALECVKEFKQPSCVIVKHANPCGVGTADTFLTAYQKAFATDSTSAFGGIIAFNGRLDVLTAQTILDNQFVEVIVAFSVDEEAQTVIAKKKNIRLLVVGESAQPVKRMELKKISSGLLIQEADQKIVMPEDLQIVTDRSPTPEEMKDLLFAWKVVKFVKSNAIVYAKNQQTIGIGAGQMSRVSSATLANIKAQEANLSVVDSVMASDAFLPFKDGLQAAVEVGVTAVIQPGGSMRDQEVIDEANKSGVAMVFSGVRHFKH